MKNINGDEFVNNRKNYVIQDIIDEIANITKINKYFIEKHLLVAINALSEKQKHYIILRYIEGYSNYAINYMEKTQSSYIKRNINAGINNIAKFISKLNDEEINEGVKNKMIVDYKALDNTERLFDTIINYDYDVKKCDYNGDINALQVLDSYEKMDTIRYGTIVLLKAYKLEKVICFNYYWYEFIMKINLFSDGIFEVGYIKYYIEYFSHYNDLNKKWVIENIDVYRNLVKMKTSRLSNNPDEYPKIYKVTDPGVQKYGSILKINLKMDKINYANITANTLKWVYSVLIHYPYLISLYNRKLETNPTKSFYIHLFLIEQFANVFTSEYIKFCNQEVLSNPIAIRRYCILSMIRSSHIDDKEITKLCHFYIHLWHNYNISNVMSNYETRFKIYDEMSHVPGLSKNIMKEEIEKINDNYFYVPNSILDIQKCKTCVTEYRTYIKNSDTSIMKYGDNETDLESSFERLTELVSATKVNDVYTYYSTHFNINYTEAKYLLNNDLKICRLHKKCKGITERVDKLIEKTSIYNFKKHLESYKELSKYLDTLESIDKADLTIIAKYTNGLNISAMSNDIPNLQGKCKKAVNMIYRKYCSTAIKSSWEQLRKAIYIFSGIEATVEDKEKAEKQMKELNYEPVGIVYKAFLRKIIKNKAKSKGEK